MLKVIEKNKQIFFLVLIVSILLVMPVILNKTSKDISLNIFENKIENLNNEKAYIEKGEIYISLDTISNNIDNDIYYDKTSKYISITNEGEMLKLYINKKEAKLNYNIINLENVVKEKNKIIYIPISCINEIYNIRGVINKNKTIYIVKNNNLEVNIKNNWVDLYSNQNINNKVNSTLTKKDKIIAYYNSLNSDFVFVKTDNESGFIEKYNLDKKSFENLSLKQKKLLNIEKEKNVNTKNSKINGVYITEYTNINSIYKNNNMNNIFIDAFQILKTNGSIDILNINKKWIIDNQKEGYKIYGNINNGYNFSNFDNTVISNIIRNSDTRDIFISNILKETINYNLDGIVIDFKNVKKMDEEIYIQFIKEMGNSLNGINKAVIIKDDLNVNSVDGSKALKYIDYYIIKGYNYRDVYSNISGTDSDISKIREDIDKIITPEKLIYSSKVIIELPAYSILWEEKNAKIINSNIYSQKEVDKFISENKLSKSIDKKAGQNYIEMKKGSIIYKMWIEDEYSLKQKNKMVTEKDLAGIIIYNSKYVNDLVIDKIFK